MALTREFRDLVAEKVRRDPGFKQALLVEALNVCLEGDVATGRIVLRNLVNATIGFEELGRRVDIPSKSLHRMLSPNGNPSSENFFAIVRALTGETEVQLSVTASRSRAKRAVRR